MNSLSELNSFASTGVEFTDSRTPGVVFNREVAFNQFISIDTTTGSYTHELKVGINIKDVIQPTVCLPTYTVDLSAAGGDATLTWDTLPSGVTATTPSANVYRLSGINSKAIWDAIKSPTITIDPTFAGGFTYTATIAYVGGAKTWDNVVSVYSFNILGPVRNYGYYLANTESSITGGPLITDVTHDGSGEYTMTIVPSDTAAIGSMTSAGRTEWVESQRITFTTNNSSTKYLSQSSDGLWLVVTNYWLNQTVATTKTASGSSGSTGILISEGTVGITEGMYVSGSGSLGGPLNIVRVTAVNPSPPSSIFVTTANDGTFNNATLSFYQPKLALVYNRESITSTTWTLAYTITDPVTIVHIDEPAISSDGSTLVLTSAYDSNATSGGEGKIHVWTRSGSTYSFQATINPSDSAPYDVIKPRISDDGNTIAVVFRDDANTPTNIAKVAIYTRSGTNWSLQTKITPTGLTVDDLIYDIDLSGDGQVLAIGCYDHNHNNYKNSGAVWTYLRSGSTWTETTKLLPSDVESYKLFGERVELNSDGTKLWTYAYGTTIHNARSPSPAIAVSGNATISTAQKKFGAGSVYFDGTGDYLTIDTSFGSSNSTVECWIYRTANNKQQYVFRADVNQTLYFTSTNYLRWGTGGSAPTEIESTSTLAVNTWYHVAVTYNSTTYVHTLYVNGVSQGTATSRIANNSSPITLGKYLSSSSVTTDFFQGYIDDFRIVRDTSDEGIVYLGNFTPPTSALTNYYGIPSTTNYNVGTKTRVLIHGDTNISDDTGQIGEVLTTQQSYVFTRTVETWYQTELLTYGEYGSLDSLLGMQDVNVYVSNNDLVTTVKTAGVGSSYDATTKTLTLTGTRSEVNTDIDQILLTPAEGYTSSFTLNYEVLTPTSDTENRDQTVYKL